MTSADLPFLPDLKQLRYFIAVCEAGSISAVAAKLGIGQATLSENIAKLEKGVGATLLVRGNRGVLLTQSGEVLLGRGCLLLDATGEMVRAVARRGAHLGALALGLPPSLGVLIGIPLAETIRSEHPGIQLRISEGLSGHILDWLTDGTLDLGFVYEMPDVDIFEAAPVFREELFLIAAADFIPAVVLESAERLMSIGALGDLPLVMPSAKHNARRILDRILRTKKITPSVVSEIDSHSQIVEMLVRANAYSVLPRVAVLQQLAAGALVAIPISGARFVRTCYCVRRRRQGVSASSILVQRTITKITVEMSDRHDLGLEFIKAGSMN